MTCCLNCGKTYEGNYCPHCGQQAKTRRLHLMDMLSDFVGSLVGGDNKFLCSCRYLVTRPGRMVYDYVVGKRAGFYNPLQLFVFLLTAYAVASYVLGVGESVFDDTQDFDFDLSDIGIGSSLLKFISDGLNKIFSNKLYSTLFIAVFAAPVYHWVFRRCKVERQDGRWLSLNFSEQFCTQIYHSCIVMIYSVAMLPLCLINGSDDVVRIVFHVVTTAYVVVLYRQLLGIGWWKSIVLNILASVLSIVLLASALGIFGIIGGLLDVMLNKVLA